MILVNLCLIHMSPLLATLLFLAFADNIAIFSFLSILVFNDNIAILGSFEVTLLSRHIQSICESISFMKEENRHHLRFKVKEILERLVRKFG